MAVVVDIGDRLYDYTDEEAANAAIALFQEQQGLSDADVVTIWHSADSELRNDLERCIFNAVDLNGSAKRAVSTVPGDILLSVDA